MEPAPVDDSASPVGPVHRTVSQLELGTDPEVIAFAVTPGLPELQTEFDEIEVTHFHHHFHSAAIPHEPIAAEPDASSSQDAKAEEEELSVVDEIPVRHALVLFGWWYWDRLVQGFKAPFAVPPPYTWAINCDLMPTLLLSFVAMFLLAVVDAYLVRQHISDSLFVFMPSFAASCALLFGLPKAPLAQPRNLFFGHLIGALCGLVITQALRNTTEQPLGNLVAGSLAVGLSTSLMMLTNTVHPPGAATALVAAGVDFTAGLNDRGFDFLITPLLPGCLILFLVAWIGNNMWPHRSPYPVYW